MKNKKILLWFSLFLIQPKIRREPIIIMTDPASHRVAKSNEDKPNEVFTNTYVLANAFEKMLLFLFLHTNIFNLLL